MPRITLTRVVIGFLIWIVVATVAGMVLFGDIHL
jgi:hypothetical protein